MNPVLSCLFAVDLIGTLAGIYVMESAQLSRKITAATSGILLGVGLFWVLPDITRTSGISHSVLSVGVAVAALYGIDRFVYPVCPCCSRHGHVHCHTGTQALLPLALAIGVHNLFDGWMAGIAAQIGSMPGSGMAAGLIAHKLPEGLVFGMMLRTASRSPKAALWSGLGTGCCLLGGYAVQAKLDLLPASTAATLSLTLACASFVFVGLHAFQQQRLKNGNRPAFFALAGGMAGAVLVEQGLAFALR